MIARIPFLASLLGGLFGRLRSGICFGQRSELCPGLLFGIRIGLLSWPVALILAGFLICGCSGGDSFDKALLSDDTVCLQIKGEDVFVFSDLTCQSAFNSDAYTFRAFTDNGSDYFSLTLSAFPTEDAVLADCSLSYTTEDSVPTRTGLEFRVRKLDSSTGLVWLWCQRSRIFALIRLPE